jgi:hypothetical protein
MNSTFGLWLRMRMRLGSSLVEITFGTVGWGEELWCRVREICIILDVYCGYEDRCEGRWRTPQLDSCSRHSIPPAVRVCYDPYQLVSIQ